MFREIIRNWLLRQAYKPFDLSQVITQRDGYLFLGEDLLTPAKIENLKVEVMKLEQFHIYKIWNNTVRAKAHEIAITKSKDFDDVKSAKMMLVDLDYLTTSMNAIRDFRLLK